MFDEKFGPLNSSDSNIDEMSYPGNAVVLECEEYWKRFDVLPEKYCLKA